jgi:hypothetical protein
VDRAKPAVITLRLRHPNLDFHVDVTLTEKDGRWLAVATLADEPDIGTGDAREALRAALAALGEPYASEMARGRGAAGVGRPDGLPGP